MRCQVDRKGREERSSCFLLKVMCLILVRLFLWQEEISLHIDLSFQEAEVEGKENKTFIIAIFFLH